MQAFTPGNVQRFVDDSGTSEIDLSRILASDGRSFVATPMVQQHVRAHFSCPDLPGALTEDGNEEAGLVEGTAGVSHFEHAVFYVCLCPLLWQSTSQPLL